MFSQKDNENSLLTRHDMYMFLMGMEHNILGLRRKNMWILDKLLDFDWVFHTYNPLGMECRMKNRLLQYNILVGIACMCEIRLRCMYQLGRELLLEQNVHPVTDLQVRDIDILLDRLSFQLRNSRTGSKGLQS